MDEDEFVGNFRQAQRRPSGASTFLSEDGQRSRRNSAVMSEDEQRSRRNDIKAIMEDSSLSAVEKRRSIQSLMDGRRRSSTTGCSISSHGSGDSHVYVNNMAADARAAAMYYDSSDDECMMPSDGEDSEFGEDEELEGVDEHLQGVAGVAGFSGVAAPAPASRNSFSTFQSPDSSLSFNSSSNNDFELEYNTALNTSGAMAVAGSVPPSVAGGTGTAASIDDNATTISTMLERKPPQRRRVARSLSLQHYDAGQIAAVAASSTSLFSKDPQAVNRRMEMSRPKCQHYERNCTLVSPCCGLAFGCRICHDECPVLPPPLSLIHKDDDENDTTDTTLITDSLLNMKPKSMKRRHSLQPDLDEEETHHEIDRFAVKEIICRLCYFRQPSKTNKCISCGIQFGEYHCSICNLWMSNKESPYHCEKCGFCRVGGRENFRHCDDCGMCIDALLFDDHNCKLGKYMSNCPVCQEDLFSSRYASHEMPCGHAIHWHCFKELTSYDTRCPVCKKTAETAEQMAPTWSAMAMGIALQPVPPELARVVTILCCDCEERDENRRWHFLGVRCMKCLSFNTTVERTVMTGREAAAFLDELEGRTGETTAAAAAAAAASDMAGGNLNAMVMNADGAGGGIPSNFGMLLASGSPDDDSLSDATMEDEDDGQETFPGSSSSSFHPR